MISCGLTREDRKEQDAQDEDESEDLDAEQFVHDHQQVQDLDAESQLSNHDSEESHQQNDLECNYCGEAGEVISCDNCRYAYHYNCLVPPTSRADPSTSSSSTTLAKYISTRPRFKSNWKCPWCLIMTIDESDEDDYNSSECHQCGQAFSRTTSAPFECHRCRHVIHEACLTKHQIVMTATEEGWECPPCALKDGIYENEPDDDESEEYVPAGGAYQLEQVDRHAMEVASSEGELEPDEDNQN